MRLVFLKVLEQYRHFEQLYQKAIVQANEENEYKNG